MVTWGNTANNLPWSCGSVEARPFTPIRARRTPAATDAIKKCQEIAAKSLGGKPEDYVLDNERVQRKGGGAGMTLAQVAQKAIELGGLYDGQRTAAGHQRGHQEVRIKPSPVRGADRRSRQLPARRCVLLVRGGLRGSRSRQGKRASTTSSITWLSPTLAPSSIRVHSAGGCSAARPSAWATR